MTPDEGTRESGAMATEARVDRAAVRWAGASLSGEAGFGPARRWIVADVA
ncbi:hypothetical protein [Actinokineospora sp. UTMC 2448]|nr:hypothetical protein [Actinokineospora sp. UTMC 2448]UVS78597.1 hypothetical protein Actkin_02331 [Actinokineospora sp. UTMC 2448]